jgi:hypothetical protein
MITERKNSMKMQIEFYSKEKMAIQIDKTGKMPFSQDDTSDLFLFALYTLRQLRNLGQHLVAKSLVGLLASESYFKKIVSKDPEIPKADSLLQSMRLHALISQPKELDAEQLAPIAKRLTDERFSMNPTHLEIFDRDYGSRIPEITNFTGNGKKSFTLTFPPFQLGTKGFGIFGMDTNYYVFHSVLGLIRFFGKERKSESEFMDNLLKVGMHCGSYHILNMISPDQTTLAIAILEEIGVSVK